MERKNRITIRLTDEELKKLEKLSSYSNLTKSEFLRELLNSVDEKEIITELAKKQEEYSKIKSYLSNIGTNVNQIARKLNMNECLTDEDKFLLEEIIRKIEKVYDEGL